MKQIKFDLPIDGTKVRTIEELRNHFNTEILDLYKNGLLLRWLKVKHYFDYSQAVEKLISADTDANLLKLLCGIFEIDVDFEIIQQLADYHGSGIRIDPEQLQYKQKYEESWARTKGKIINFDDEFIGSVISMKDVVKWHKYHTGRKILLVAVQCDLYEKDFESVLGSHRYSKGDYISRGENLLTNRFEALAPCDGVLYKKVFLMKTGFSHSNMRNIAYIHVNVL